MSAPIELFPPDCAEQVVFVFHSRKAFVKAKARQHPPHVRVFCDKVRTGIAPEDFYP